MTLAVTSLVMLELPVRQLQFVASIKAAHGPCVSFMWRRPIELHDGWSHAAVALLPLAALALWCGVRRRHTRAAVVVAVIGVAIILAGLLCPLPFGARWGGLTNQMQ